MSSQLGLTALVQNAPDPPETTSQGSYGDANVLNIVSQYDIVGTDGAYSNTVVLNTGAQIWNQFGSDGTHSEDGEFKKHF